MIVCDFTKAKVTAAALPYYLAEHIFDALFETKRNSLKLTDVLAADFRSGLDAMACMGPLNLADELVSACVLQAVAASIAATPGLPELLTETGLQPLLAELETGRFQNAQASYDLLVAKRDELRRERNLLQDNPTPSLFDVPKIERVIRRLHMVCALEKLAFGGTWLGKPDCLDIAYDVNQTVGMLYEAAHAPFIPRPIGSGHFLGGGTHLPADPEQRQAYRKAFANRFLGFYAQAPSTGHRTH